jgi:hypothetical protein
LLLKNELNEVLVKNRQLNSSLTESQTQLAITRSELAQVNTFYDEKNYELE